MLYYHFVSNNITAIFVFRNKNTDKEKFLNEISIIVLFSANREKICKFTIIFFPKTKTTVLAPMF